jgi:hypothetical protein
VLEGRAQREAKILDLQGGGIAEAGDHAMGRHAVRAAKALDELGVLTSDTLAGNAHHADVHMMYLHKNRQKSQHKS